MTVTVTADKQGTPRPPFWQRLRGRSIRVRVRFRMGTKGAVIKLFGLTDFSCLWRFRRVKKGGWSHLLSADHETSDRIVAVWGERGVTLRAYPYREGSGPATDGASYSETLCTVPVSEDPAWTEWRTLHLAYSPEKLMIYAESYDDQSWGESLSVDSPRRTPLQWLTWSHGRNGDGGLASPVQYELEVL